MNHFIGGCMVEKFNKNEVFLIGKLEKQDFDSCFVRGYKIFTNYLLVERLSGTIDRIPIRIWETQFNNISKEVWKEKVNITGEIITFNEKRHLYLYVSILNVTACGFSVQDENLVSLEGHICSSTYRETPFGRKITDVTLACNRNPKKTSYIPSLVWGQQAIALKNESIGSKIFATGRLQSRKYLKKYEDGSYEEKETYEFSISNYVLE